MLKRPSSRGNSEKRSAEPNLVPVIDTMVTLIAFLLFTTSFLSIVSIESPFPQVSASVVQEKIKEKPLQLTVTLRDKETEIWSPFGKITPKVIPNSEPGKPDIKALHESLIGVKQKFPVETKVVLVPTRGTAYDTLIQSMDAMRMLEPTDPPIFVKNAQTGIDEPLKVLFPEVIFGNLLGDT